MKSEIPLSRFLSPPFFFIKSRRRLRLRRLRRSRKEREILLLKKRLARVGRGPFSRGPFWEGRRGAYVEKRGSKVNKEEEFPGRVGGEMKRGEREEVRNLEEEESIRFLGEGEKKEVA